jgi:glycosyltransferase involved in cell wall biosynthesis
VTSNPLVSILINNYNYGRYLGQAIESALQQTYRDIEIVVVDDGSTDNSRDVIAGFGDRIRPILKENGGQASAYNAGFAASTGDIICLLDSDDLFAPAKVARIVEIFQQSPALGWCFDRVHEFDEDTGSRRAPVEAYAYGRWDVRKMTAAGKPPHIPTSSSGLSFRRDTLTHIFPMPELMRITTGSCPDAYVKWIAMALAEGWFTAEELTHQRIHGTNAYTRRHADSRCLSGQLELLTSICLTDRCPILRRLAVKVFSRGLGKLWTYGGIEAAYKQPMRMFVRSLTVPERLNVAVRTLCWTAVEQFHARKFAMHRNIVSSQ